MSTNTLARIADRYWILRDRDARTLGVVVQLADGMYSVYSDQLDTICANINAVTDCTNSDELDYRLATTTIS